MPGRLTNLYVRRTFATAFAGIILVGNISFPIMVQADVISESHEVCSPNSQEVGCIGPKVGVHG